MAIDQFGSLQGLAREEGSARWLASRSHQALEEATRAACELVFHLLPKLQSRSGGLVTCSGPGMTSVFAQKIGSELGRFLAGLTLIEPRSGPAEGAAMLALFHSTKSSV